LKISITIVLILAALVAKTQQVDSIYFHLYTDSLKKQVHNYINVDGKLPTGKYLPLTNKELIFWSNTGIWEGNDLIIDPSYTGDSVLIKATLKTDNQKSKAIVIYIKKSSNYGHVLTEEELSHKLDSELTAPKKKKN